MTTIQEQALKIFAEHSLGAVAIDGVWVFPSHVRNDGDRYGDESAEIWATEIVRRYGDKTEETSR